jgi:hypothetical protein
MWKVLLLAALCAFNLHAETVGNTDEMGGDEGMDAEEYAVTPGNPQEGDDPVTGERNDPAACLSADTVKRYEKGARKTIAAIEKSAKKNKTAGYSLRHVREALQAGGLYPKGKKITKSARDAGPSLKAEKFVNLMECKEWRAKIKNGSGNLPLGAVLIYDGGRNGDARIKTPSGCLQGEGSSKSCTSPNRKLTGVYVKVMN